MKEGFDRPKESAIDLVHIAHVILEHDTPYSRVKAHFIFRGIHKQNKNSDEIIEPLPKL